MCSPGPGGAYQLGRAFLADRSAATTRAPWRRSELQVDEVELVTGDHVDRHLDIVRQLLERSSIVIADHVSITHALAAVDREAMPFGDVDCREETDMMRESLTATNGEAFHRRA